MDYHRIVGLYKDWTGLYSLLVPYILPLNVLSSDGVAEDCKRIWDCAGIVRIELPSCMGDMVGRSYSYFFNWGAVCRAT